MKTVLPMILVSAAALAACAPTETITFQSEKERQCYEQTVAGFTSPNKSLERNRDGVFVEVIRVDGFVRDVDASAAFTTCMQSTGFAPASAVTNAAPVTFTPEEASLWNTLTDAQKREALAFIQQGGTLRGYLES